MFTEKIVELGVPLRRERKIAQSEAKEVDQDEATTASTKSDMIINLVDFPKNQEELELFLNQRNALNKMIAIMEK